MKKRLTSLMLCLLMLSSTLISCSESSQNADEPQETTPSPSLADTTDPIETEDLTDYELRQLISDDLPNITFDGEEFRVLTSADGYEGKVTKRSEIISDELNGDACNDAVYNRNIVIEDRFDTKIICETHSDPHSYVNTFVIAGTPDYHLVGFYDYLAATAISGQSLLNWNDAEYVNLDKPWHNSLANDAATIFGTLYAICSDLSISSMTYTYAMFFNLDLIEDYGHTSAEMYETVREGKWTIDMLSETVSSMYQDKNGDSNRDKNDTYGFAYQVTNPSDVWLAAFDQPICEVDDEEGIIVTYMCEKTVSIVEKLMDFHYNNNGVFLYPTQYDEESYFLEGNVVFAPLRFYAAYNILRDMEDGYSILPYPKWDENQEKYLTNADDKFTVFGLPLTSYEYLDFVSVIYEALCAESYKTVYPEYYDTALKGKYSQEPETAEMVDLIMEGRDFDFSFQFSGGIFKDLPYFVRHHLNDKDTNVASKYKKSEKVITRAIQKDLLKLYDKD